MIAEKMKPFLQNNSAIRAMFEEGKKMAAEFGADKVYDFSLGNPNVPAPEAIKDAIREILDEEDPVFVHGYMSNAGFPHVRKAIADNLNERFGTSFHENNLIMTVGAGSGLNVCLKTLLDPGDEVIVFAPYFLEYGSYIRNYDGVLVQVDPDTTAFQLNLEDFAAKITERTKAVIVNNPHNPTGVIFSEETIQSLAAIMEEKERRYGHAIYLISDEPYRELAFDGAFVPFVTKYYRNTMVVYSYSKSLSLPGERIGYVVIPDEVEDSANTIAAATIANRISGCVNAPSLIQLAVARCVDAQVDLEFYDRNRRTLYEGLTDLGFTCVRPEGAFYLWVKSPEADERQFVEKAKKYHILAVPGSSFACPGYVRLAYCVSHETIVNSLPAFKKLAEEYF
jgi:aspartate aminotransferase